MADHEVTVEIGADIGGLTRGINEATNRLSNFGKTMSGGLGALRNIGGIVAGAGAAMSVAAGGFLGAGLKYNAAMEQTATGMTTLTGSAKETKRIMADLQKYATQTPFDFEGLTRGQRLLMGMGMSAEQATSTLKATADAVAATGGSSATLEGVIIALGQMQTKGKVSAEEMMQLSERMIPAWQILADEMGKTPAQLQDMAAKGDLLAKDALPALVQGFMAAFGGAAQEQATTFTGRLQNLFEQFNILAGAFSQPIFEPISNTMAALIPKVQALVTWFQTLPVPIQTVTTALMVIVPVLTLLSGGALVFLTMLPSIATGLGLVATAFGTTTGAMLVTVGVIAGVVAALAAIGVGLVIAYNKVGWFRDMVNAAWAAISTAWNAALTFISGIVHTIIAEVSSFMGAQLAKIAAFWAKNGDTIMTIVSTAMKNIWAVIQGIMGVIKGIFQAVWPVISGIVKIAWGVIKLAVSNGLDVILGVIDAVMSLIRGDWQGAWNSIKGIAKNIMNNIIGFFEGIDLWQTGKNIIQGLINGFKSMVGAVGRTIKNIANNITGGIKSILGIHSPSRVFKGIGEMTGQGLIDGIGGMIGGVSKITDKMAAATMIDPQAMSLSMAAPSMPAPPVVSSTADVIPTTDTAAAGGQPKAKQPLVVNIEMSKRQVAKAIIDDINELRGNQLTDRMIFN